MPKLTVSTIKHQCLFSEALIIETKPMNDFTKDTIQSMERRSCIPAKAGPVNTLLTL